MLSKIWCLAVLVVSELSFWHGACWTLAQRMRRMKQRSKSQAIKKVIGGLIMIAVPAILKLLGVS